jgi:hypothetical protein
MAGVAQSGFFKRSQAGLGPGRGSAPGVPRVVVFPAHRRLHCLYCRESCFRTPGLAAGGQAWFPLRPEQGGVIPKILPVVQENSALIKKSRILVHFF